MTNTSFIEFKKFLARVPASNLKATAFLPVHQDRKFPDVPYGTKIKLDSGLINPTVKIDVRTCIQRLKQGKNIAIYAFPNGLMFLDVDVENGKIKASEDFLKSIPPTLTIKSRNGGLQFFYLNPGGISTQDISENDINIGELRANWSYVVGVGSYVPPDDNNNGGDGTYRVVNDVPIVAMPTEFLNKIKTMVSNKEEKPTAQTPRPPKQTTTKEDYKKMLREKGKIFRRLI